MRTLIGFIIITLLLTILSSCKFSTNPKDHGLPTIEELLPLMKHDMSFGTTNDKVKEIGQVFIEEKEFFYKYANKCYLDNKSKSHWPDNWNDETFYGIGNQFLAQILMKKMKKEQPPEWKKLIAHDQYLIDYCGADHYNLIHWYFKALIRSQSKNF